MTTCYLDVNAWNYFFTARGWSPTRLEAARYALLLAVRREELVALGSQRHLEEFARAVYAHPEVYLHLLPFFWDVVGARLLLPTDDLVREEARLGRPLRGNEPFDTWERRQGIRSASKRLNDICIKNGTVSAKKGEGPSG